MELNTVKNNNMKETKPELISNYTHISFICSFGYTIKERTHEKNRMNDKYLLVDDWGREFNVMRKDFWKHVCEHHGNVEKGTPEMNATADYDLFCYGMIKSASKWTRSRVLRDLLF